MINDPLYNPEEIAQRSYMHMVKTFVTLMDAQLARYEDKAHKGDMRDVAQQMPALISLVNTIGYMRGQDGVFLDIRPYGLDQKELYSYEDEYEARLKKLIDQVLESDAKDYYLERLEQYFIQARSA